MTFEAKTTKSTVIPLPTLGVQGVRCFLLQILGIVFDAELSDDKDIQSRTVARKSSLGGLILKI